MMQHTAHSTPLQDGSLPAGSQGFAHPARNVLHFSVEPGMQIADFGAGSGHYVWPLAEAAGENGRVYAIDVQQDLLKRIHNDAVKRGAKNVKIISADLEKPKASKIADKTLDLVLISNLLFQVEDKAAVLREAKRILKVSGRLAVIDWADSFDGMGPHRKSVITKDSALKFIRDTWFEPVGEFDAGAHHYGLLARSIA